MFDCGFTREKIGSDIVRRPLSLKTTASYLPETNGKIICIPSAARYIWEKLWKMRSFRKFLKKLEFIMKLTVWL